MTDGPASIADGSTTLRCTMRIDVKENVSGKLAKELEQASQSQRALLLSYILEAVNDGEDGVSVTIELT